MASTSSNQSESSASSLQKIENLRKMKQNAKHCHNSTCFGKFKRRKMSATSCNSFGEDSNGILGFSNQNNFRYMQLKDGVPTLLDSAAKVVAKHISFAAVDEKLSGRIPEPVQWRLLFWAFPDDERRIRLYSSKTVRQNNSSTCSECPASSSKQSCSKKCRLGASDLDAGNFTPSMNEDSCSTSSDDCSPFADGLRLLESDCVDEVIQIGNLLSGVVRPLKSSSSSDSRNSSVSLSFDRHRINQVTCSCDRRDIFWCHHAVALALYRIRRPENVKYRFALSENLSQLDRNQLQKLVQYLISKSELCSEIVPATQKILDELLQRDSSLNAIEGAPDVTMGALKESESWFFDETQVRSRIRSYLIHSFRLDELQALFAKVCEMLHHKDENGSKFLRIITEEFLCSISTPNSVGGGRSLILPNATNNVNQSTSSTTANTSKTQHEKLQQLWEKIGMTWVCVVLNPFSRLENKAEWQELLKSWILLPNCPTESTFSLPSNVFCDIHAYRMNGCSERSIFSRALQACQMSMRKEAFLEKLLNNFSCNNDELADPFQIDLPQKWPESVPFTCARIESLKMNGYNGKARLLAITLARSIAEDQEKNFPTLQDCSPNNFPYWSLNSAPFYNDDEPWIGHTFDPINSLFDSLYEEFKNAKNGKAQLAPRSDFLRLAVEVALVACARPRPINNCRYVKDKVCEQEERLLAKLKKLNLEKDDNLLQLVKKRALQLLKDTNDSYNAILNANMYLPLNSLANFFFHIFLYKDPDLAYKIGLEAFKNPSNEAFNDDSAIMIGSLLSWPSSLPSDSTGSAEVKNKQSSLASSLIIAAKDDSERLALVLNAIRVNNKNTSLLYHLAYDIYNESLNHAEGSRSRSNMLNIAFELGLQVLRTPTSQPSWCRPNVVRWVVNCATCLNFDSLIYIIRQWSDFFSPLEAVSVVARVAWSETVNVQLKLETAQRSALAHYVQQMALECTTKNPVECSLHALSICKNNEKCFEQVFDVISKAGERRIMSAEELFAVAQHLERLLLVPSAYRLGTVAANNLRLGYADDDSPGAQGAYWLCSLARQIGLLEVDHVIRILCQNVKSPVILTNMLKMCLCQQPIATHHQHVCYRLCDKQWSTNSAASIRAQLLNQPHLRLLLDACIAAYVEGVHARLHHISPRHYCDFVELLLRARQVFGLIDDGQRQFAHFLEHLKLLYKGKKKLVALITHKIG